MTYTFRNDRLEISGRAVPYRAARDVGGRITPTLIILHDTAGGLDAVGSIRWLAGNPNKTSAHFVVARDGTVTQLAPPDRKCNHAGESTWRGRQYCNGFAVGIEIVNPGKLLERGTGAVASFGTVYDRNRYSIERSYSKAHGGDGWWMPYTTAQLESVEHLVEALSRAYPTITEVVGHHDVSPGRKCDPTPLMDWDRMRAALARARRVVSPPETPPVDIAAVQTELARLGYYHGDVDGRLGSVTVGAIAAMQHENAMQSTGRLDVSTLRLLLSGDAKGRPTGHREEATVETLAASGSQTIPLAKADKVEGSIQTMMAGVMAFVLSVKSFLSEAGLTIGLVAIGGVVAYFGIRQLKRGGHLEWLRLSEYQSGKK